jgi:hypothetical protein
MMTKVVLPIPPQSGGLYRNYWVAGESLYTGRNPKVCGQSNVYICTREPGHDGPHAAHQSYTPNSPLCDLWLVGDPDLQMDIGL